MALARYFIAAVERYVYNHRGERIMRMPVAGAAQITLYDEAGRWIGNYSATGEPQQQAIWLDDHPVALMTAPAPGVPALAYVQPDHLGTPRVVIDSERDVAIWRWPFAGEAFGADAPEEDPDGDGVPYELNLRFPGQQYTAATGLYYNYQRDLDAASGRYVQSDPIGLVGGISTYGYVYGNPVGYMDPYGLWTWGDPIPQGIVDFSAGTGDTLSFKLTNRARERMGIDGEVNSCSGYYAGGEATGVVVSTFAGGAAGWRAAGSKGPGREFSHWIPNRMKGPRSKWNGNYVRPSQHYYHDPYRYPKGWRDLGPKYPAWLQQLDRVPKVYKGASAGLASGSAGAYSSQWGLD